MKQFTFLLILFLALFTSCGYEVQNPQPYEQIPLEETLTIQPGYDFLWSTIFRDGTSTLMFILGILLIAVAAFIIFWSIKKNGGAWSAGANRGLFALLAGAALLMLGPVTRNKIDYEVQVKKSTWEQFTEAERKQVFLDKHYQNRQIIEAAKQRK